MIEVLSNFFELTEEQKQEYDFVKKLQGEYVPDDAQDSGVSVIITGYEIQINDTVDMFSFKTYSSIEGSAYLSKRLVLDNGGEVEDVTPVSSLLPDNGTSKKYISAAGQEHQKKIEEKMKAEEESKAQAEREYLANEPRVGMTSEEVLKSNWGKPNDIIKPPIPGVSRNNGFIQGNKYIYIDGWHCYGYFRINYLLTFKIIKKTRHSIFLNQTGICCACYYLFAVDSCSSSSPANTLC